VSAACVFATALAVVAAHAAAAQSPQAEVRGDVLGPRPYSVQAGVGLIVPLGYYVRASADAGYAPSANASLVADHWRGDLLARFTLDPFREERCGLSLGGGLSFRRHTFLAAVVDLEGPETHGMLPALQVGLSGGIRGALILRRAVKGRR
jgi:hypothetical protein